MNRAVGLATLFLGLGAGILFGAAGRLDWEMGWGYLCTWVVFTIVAFVSADRELIIERSQMKAGVKSWDVRLATIAFLWAFPLTLLVAGLDAVRFRWSPVIPFAVQGLFFAVFVLGTALALWAMLANRFFSTFVRIQTERAHEVISDGPYRYIRHPGYAGLIVGTIAVPLALGSLYALMPATVGALLFIIRTVWEDNTLRNELIGYPEYITKVRWRLVPGVW